jgi:myo-inositol-1(or 4)-monophosphatase
MDGATSDLDLLVDAAEAAGELALRFFRQNPKNWAKGLSSIVSEADIAVDRLLLDKLSAARPDYGWLSEETTDNSARLSRQRVFVVDPIDGTRAFLAGDREWTVSLAVVEAGRPVVAALYAPALELMFRASAGSGGTRDGEPLRVSGRSEPVGTRLAGPRRYARKLAEAAGLSTAEARFVPSLAYRIALVAAGEVDAAVARPNAHDWDLAAADLLVHEAGGVLTDLSGRELRYNGADVRHPALVAANPALARTLAPILAEA